MFRERVSVTFILTACERGVTSNAAVDGVVLLKKLCGVQFELAVFTI